jgi:pimeloyl-ACP methyl ester carboxylesterase
MVKLDQTFVHKTVTHEFTIKWVKAGPSSLPPLVFIHGTPWSHIEWDELAASLSSHYQIFLYDHPGFGASPSPRRLAQVENQARIDLDPSLSLRAEASAALFKHWNLSSHPHVVAHDNGGLVSLRLLLQHDILFTSLCLVDVVVLSRKAEIPFFKLVAENEQVFNAIPPHLIEGFVRSYVKSAAFKPLSSEAENALCEPWLAGGSQGPLRFLQEMIQAHHRDVGEIEEKYHLAGDLVPIKVIWGEDDFWIPVATAQRLKDALGAKAMTTIKDAGHLITYDQPSKLAVEVSMWLLSQSHQGQ